MPTIVVLDGYTLNPGDNPWDGIAALGELTVHERTSPELILGHAQGADIVLTNKTPLTAETIARLPDLRFIGVLATGYNVVDVQAARARGIAVSNVPAYGTDAVAEFVLALILNFYRNPQHHSDRVKQGEWARRGDFSFWDTPQQGLRGKTLGIVGFGRIGRRVGELAAAFGARVIANNRSQTNAPAYPFAWRTVAEIFAESDIVSLHCPLTESNIRMVDADLLGRMKKTAFLINTARGPLVDEAALADALAAGGLAGAALDVIAVEPIRADNPLLTAPNVVLTPHIAWAARDARSTLTAIMAGNIRAFLAGKPQNVVNPGR